MKVRASTFKIKLEILALNSNFRKTPCEAFNETGMGTENFTSLLIGRIALGTFFLIALIFPLHVFSQLHDPFGSEKLQFDRLDQVKGLENRTVTSIVQDDYGFMWFGTLAGLIRFDGNEIRQYENDRRHLASAEGYASSVGIVVCLSRYSTRIADAYT